MSMRATIIYLVVLAALAAYVVAGIIKWDKEIETKKARQDRTDPGAYIYIDKMNGN